MHEIKSPFLILMEEQSYLAQSLESAFEKQNVKVKIVTIAEASPPTDYAMKPCANQSKNL